MQPSFLPWLGYFDLLLRSDLFLVYDNVQFDKDGWRNRNRIKTPNGPQWITVPVLTKGLNKPTNAEILINHKENWKKKHLGSFQMNYTRAPHYREVMALIEPVYAAEHERLLDLNMALLKTFCEYLDIPTPFRLASELGLELPEDKTAKLVTICKHLQANEFYEPKGGEGYIEPAQFEAAGIRLEFQNYAHPEYPQLHGAFVSHLSIVDLLFNCGKSSLAVLKTH